MTSGQVAAAAEARRSKLAVNLGEKATGEVRCRPVDRTSAVNVIKLAFSSSTNELERLSLAGLNIIILFQKNIQLYWHINLRF